MSGKMANVIAIELAILIAVLVWLGISRGPSVALRPAAQERGRADDLFAAVAPVRKSRSQNFQATNDDAAGEGLAEAIEQQPPTAPEYDQGLVSEGYPSSEQGEALVAETEPYYTAVDYTAVDQAPVVGSPDYYVAPVEEVVEFVQPSQIIVLSNTRSCARPYRHPPRSSGSPVTVRPQCPRGGSLPTSGGSLPPPPKPAGALVPRQNAGGRSAPRRTVSARVVPQKQGLQARWDP